MKRWGQLTNDELLSLIVVLEGKQFTDDDLNRVKAKFPGLLG